MSVQLLRRRCWPVRFAAGASLWLGLLSNLHAADPPTFQDVVGQHFDRWTHGGKSALTPAAVNALVLRPDIKGPEAAAVAAIHCYQRKGGKGAQPVTREFLTAPRKEDASLRRDQAASGGNLSLNYKGFLKHLQTVPHKVFTVEKPNLDGIAQGHLGDCYFVAGVGAAAHLSPDRLKSLIHANADGSCDLRFPDGRHIHVPRLTDAQLALGSNAGDQGIWLNVLEVAAGMAEEEHQKRTKQSALDVVGAGGDSVFTIELLSGHKAVKDLIRAHVKGERPAPAERDIPRLASQIGRQIHEGLAKNRLICCGIGEWPVPPGMGKGHQYAIIGIEKGHVEIWNPWGCNYHFEPKGEPGLEHGYPTKAGRFSMPIHDFIRVYGGVNIETDQRMR